MIKTTNSVQYQELIDYLKKIRKNRGLSIRDLATSLGVAHSFVGRVETLERKLDVREYVQFCKTLDIDPMFGIEILQKEE